MGALHLILLDSMFNFLILEINKETLMLLEILFSAKVYAVNYINAILTYAELGIKIFIHIVASQFSRLLMKMYLLISNIPFVNVSELNSMLML